MKRYETQSKNLYEHAIRLASPFCSGAGIRAAPRAETVTFSHHQNFFLPCSQTACKK